MKVLLDTNVIMDVLQSRDPWYRDGQAIFLLAAGNTIDAYITANAVTDIHYLLKHSLHDEKKTRKLLHTLFQLFTILDTCGIDCEKALHSNLKDYEDAVMHEAAKREGIDCIITRDTADLKGASVNVYLPSQFLEKYGVR
ncbi:MAG: PIN domain-containing protein [Solobacterium sp.]|nr:PIN domain-containing protein [Solobacterium sp.]